jgi:hypothetical protein
VDLKPKAIGAGSPSKRVGYGWLQKAEGSSSDALIEDPLEVAVWEGSREDLMHVHCLVSMCNGT